MVSFETLAAPLFAAALMLAGAGASKLRRPTLTARALYVAGLPSASWLVRTLGLAELAVGVAVLISPTRLATTAAAVLYAAFAIFLVSLLLRRTAGASCGCAGARDAPPSWLHVLLNLAAAGVAFAVATLDVTPPGILAFAGKQPFAGIPFVFGVLLIAWLAGLVVTYVPTLFASYRGTRGTDGTRGTAGA